ncbi:MAG: preprotein translocase subunit SecY, partial [Gammaproteobacteria bacterium]|nr:preprotein translocase subunit SecY [Gammaproteobacteria bacterium]
MSSVAPAIPGGLAGLSKLKELRQRLVFVLVALFVFRICTHIPVPGIDAKALVDMFDRQSGTILDMFNMFSGGALERLSVVALGIMPYISASIIMQLLSFIDPRLKQLRKEGEMGRRKITQYTRYGTVLLATFQGIGVAIALEGQNVVLNPGLGFRITAVVSLVTGTMFLMWLGEQITERGVGNGISLIIFAGIVAGLPSAIGGTLELSRTGEMH